MIVPLVLHDISHNKPKTFETISFVTFELILEQIKGDDVLLNAAKIFKKHDHKKWILTFDDGYSSHFTIVFPALMERNMRGVFYLNSGVIDTKGFISWNQARELEKFGMTIGSHGHNHLNFLKLNNQEALQELMLSKNIIQEKLGCAIDSFSFPFGFYNKRLINLAKQAGYKIISISDHGVIRNSTSIIPRNSLNGQMNVSQIISSINPSLTKEIIWNIEDVTKLILKKTVPDKIYNLVRKYAIQAL
jgi:peptidoglycan/xylan/chitin deacetylase (PgdA/CDA1 family)